VAGLPYKRFPRLLKREIVKQAAMMLNLLPHPDGVSHVLSPRTIVTGLQADFTTHCRVPIGAYCEVHDEPNPTNTETERTTTAIALGPTNNLQGSYYFMSLQTGKQISRRRWTEKPATPAVITRVHDLANAEANAPLLDDPFQFNWTPDLPIIDIPHLEAPPVPPVEGAADNDNEPEPNNNNENEDEDNENNNDNETNDYDQDNDNENNDNNDQDNDNENNNDNDQDYDQDNDNENNDNNDQDNDNENNNDNDQETHDYDQDNDNENNDNNDQDNDNENNNDNDQETQQEDNEPYDQQDDTDDEESETDDDQYDHYDHYEQDQEEPHDQDQEETDPNEYHATDAVELVETPHDTNDDILQDNELTLPTPTRLNSRDRRTIRRNQRRQPTITDIEQHDTNQGANETQEITFENEGAQASTPLFEPLPDSGAEKHVHLAQTSPIPKNSGATSLRTRDWTSNLSQAARFLDTNSPTSYKAEPMDRRLTVNAITHILLTQMTANKGVKEYGDRAVSAIIKEYDQLDKKNAFQPRYFKSMTSEERARALRSITLIKEKRSGVIKGRTVADGRPQRKYKAAEDVHSPTVSTEGLMTTLAIDAKENRYVVTADVEGAYLHADMDELVIMMFDGDMVDYMVQTNPEKYAKYVHVTKNGKKILYVELIKALYGCIQSAMLWWKLLTSTLEKEGFKVNPYDPCVANKIMPDGTQCTICWYVDDLKISHISKDVVEDMVSKIEERYGKMTVTRGNKHTYIGMDIEFIGNGEVQILMKDYIREAIELFPEDCTGTVATPAANHLFKVNPTGTKLSEPRRELLHSITAKLLFVSKRARPDSQVPIAFLTSRVTKADVDDWGKLWRLLKYLNGTIDLPLTLSIDDMCVVKTWVDAAFATHYDMRSHAGGYITMGKGTLYASSKRQKLNTKSSTEAELVGAGDFLPQTIWTANFIEAQGYKVKRSEYHQDNQSAMKMEKNGRQSAGQRSRHINIRYFFIKDKIDKGEISLIYCPTGEMIADFFTKPQQGGMFTRFRDVVMGVTHHSSIRVPTSQGQERVENRALERAEDSK
jgi:hypothetical protein